MDLSPPDEVLFGCSSAMQDVRKWATRICGTNIPVLLNGSGGTGKEVLARWIHRHSPWSNGHFVKVNCAAIPGSLLESELFGYEKGAFTGAHTSKPGRVELAHHGTLFLDGIADLPLDLQSKLLQFLQDGRFSRIGDESERAVETRLICATNKDLAEDARICITALMSSACGCRVYASAAKTSHSWLSIFERSSKRNSSRNPSP